MSIESEKYNVSSAERERSYESKESKEGEIDPELKAAAAMERADYLVGEVQNSKKQIQNIVVHMSQVLATLKQLRQQLQISESDTEESSVGQDKKRVEDLKKKIVEHKDELLKMKDELIEGQIAELSKTDSSASAEVLRAKAEEMVQNVLNELEK